MSSPEAFVRVCANNAPLRQRMSNESGVLPSFDKVVLPAIKRLPPVCSSNGMGADLQNMQVPELPDLHRSLQELKDVQWWGIASAYSIAQQPYALYALAGGQAWMEKLERFEETADEAEIDRLGEEFATLVATENSATDLCDVKPCPSRRSATSRSVEASGRRERQ